VLASDYDKQVIRLMVTSLRLLCVSPCLVSRSGDAEIAGLDNDGPVWQGWTL